jgi:hypothetical protein
MIAANISQAWIIHEPRRLQCEASKGEAVLGYCEPLCNKQMLQDRLPEGENAGLGLSCVMEKNGVFMNSQAS